jgi:hypothetical protein
LSSTRGGTYAVGVYTTRVTGRGEDGGGGGGKGRECE